MGDPLEKTYENGRVEETRERWLSGNIVEIGMACGTVALNIWADHRRWRLYSFFFAQLGIVGVPNTRAIQSVADESVPFFGSVGDRILGTVAGAAERLRVFVPSRSSSSGEETSTSE